MKIGLMTTPWGNPSGVAHIAQLAKQRRARIHLGRGTQPPSGADQTCFQLRYFRVLSTVPDPYVTLTAIATVTSQSGSEQPYLFAPSMTAANGKDAGYPGPPLGRSFRMGYWIRLNRLELVNRGVDPRHRMSRYAEVVRAVRNLRTCESASAAGDHVRFTESWSWPKPVQQPHRPILLG
jgi:hypothetical protein